MEDSILSQDKKKVSYEKKNPKWKEMKQNIFLFQDMKNTSASSCFIGLRR